MSHPHQSYDAIIVGAGHAGAEAALAIARAGYQTLLLTLNLDVICKMSCNPAIGGLAKGHMVREIDALGGQMALATDATGIQFRMLNRSKGPAVWAPRAQCDKKQYQDFMKRTVEETPNVDLTQDAAEELIVHHGCAVGVRTQTGREFYAACVILTTGTFLNGLIHVGEVNYAGGRAGEFAAHGLTESLRAHGLQIARFKTGTPPRLHKRSINFDALIAQPGDDPPHPFSFRTHNFRPQQVPCFITYTNEQTHNIIKQNLHRSPLYSGVIKSTGPRYCPSIEDKVVKFQDKTKHQLYLEPEGLKTEEIYVNGLSTSLPQDVQFQIVRSIQGLENAEIMRLGYAIEYDYCPPTQLSAALESKTIKNLFMAGQINGTTGYEEAAAQGLIAGLNVIRRLRGEGPFILDRAEAYIGVLIDDLVTRGTNEPYRMFTSRAEFRLLLRQDNADERLMKYGYQFGLIDEETFRSARDKSKQVAREIKRLKSLQHENVPLDRWLRRPGVAYEDLPLVEPSGELTEEMITQIELNVKYEGYIARQLTERKRFHYAEHKKIPATVDYWQVRNMSYEAREKLTRARPASIGQASRIPGVTACDLSVLLCHIEELSKVQAQLAQ